MQEERGRIKEGNRIIAEFIDISDFKIDPDSGRFLVSRNCPITGWYDVDELKFHSSWDWLMPVVEKIESFKCLGIDKTYVQINDKSCGIWTYFDVREFLRLTGDDKNENGRFKVKIAAKSKIEAVWLAVVDFLKWYNQQPR